MYPICPSMSEQSDSRHSRNTYAIDFFYPEVTRIVTYTMFNLI